MQIEDVGDVSRWVCSRFRMDLYAGSLDLAVTYSGDGFLMWAGEDGILVPSRYTDRPRPIIFGFAFINNCLSCFEMKEWCFFVTSNR